MKKELTILICAMIMISLVIPTLGASDDPKMHVEAGETLMIEGTGTIARELLAQSEWGYGGQRLSEDLYSTWFGTDGLSNISFSSDLNVYIGMSDEHEEEEVTEITYGQTAMTTNVDHTVCLRNYEVGAATGFSTRGTSVKAFEAEMFPDSNYMQLEGIFNGKTRLRHVVVDPESGLKIVKQITDLKGEYEIDWSAYANQLLYPGAEGDWLGCP